MAPRLNKAHRFNPKNAEKTDKLIRLYLKKILSKGFRLVNKVLKCWVTAKERQRNSNGNGIARLKALNPDLSKKNYKYWWFLLAMELKLQETNRGK